jgi:hypothetical protein
MNYNKIYNNLIENAKTRSLDGYVEKHHIIPKCIGGSDDKNNLVCLTPEEHYIAHQLLVKIYPNNKRIIQAAIMMIPNRPSNKLYGWLRRRFSKMQSLSQSGENNTQWGTVWIHNKELKQSKKLSKNDKIPDGWYKGRILDWDKPLKEYNHCPNCNNLKAVERKFCSLSCSAKYNILLRDTIFKDHLEGMINDYKNGMSINKCLTTRNFCGTGANHSKLTKIIKELGGKSIRADTSL